MKKLFFVLTFILSNWAIAQTYSANQSVLISWKGEWYPGKIIELKNDSYLISYDNFESSWNEVVGTDRLKPIEIEGNSTIISKESTTTSNPVSTQTVTSTSSGKPTANTMEAKVSEMCACQKAAAASGSASDRAKCMDLRDVHLSTFEKDGEDYYTYKRLIFECQQ
jgi:hypothetical protein